MGRWWIGAIILFVVFQALSGASISPLLIFLFIGLIAFLASMGQARRPAEDSRRRNRRSIQEVSRRPARAEAPYVPPITNTKAITPQSIAEQAVRRAGNKTDAWLLKLEDIGVLAYHGDNSPDVVRVNPVAANSSHLRPFVVINLPYQQGKGTIRFELMDEDGRKRYEYSNLYHLKHGQNFLTPQTWLPLPEDRDTGRWRLRVSIGDKPLAQHDFTVRGEAEMTSQVRSILREDGEIDPWLAQAIADQDAIGGGMSLDDLLANQPDDLEAAEGKLR